MKNLINEQISTWLSKYIQHATDKTTLRIAAELLPKLPKALSLLDLAQLLLAHTTKNTNIPNETPSRYGAINFYSHLLDWQKSLTKRQKKQQDGLALLRTIPSTVKSAPLFLILQELLNEPFVLLHRKASTLLHLITEQNIVTIMDLLAQAPIRLPEYPKAGRRFYFTQNRAYAQDLLDLLKKSNTKHHLARTEACNLITVILYFYKEDMNLVEIDLSSEEIKEIKVQKNKTPKQHHKKKCVIS